MAVGNHQNPRSARPRIHVSSRLVSGASYSVWLIWGWVLAAYLLPHSVPYQDQRIRVWLVVYCFFSVFISLWRKFHFRSYNLAIARSARTQANIMAVSALIWISGGTRSYFAFLYVLPLFVTIIYSSKPRPVALIYAEAAALYSIAALARDYRTQAGSDLVRFLSYQLILAVLTYVFYVLVREIRRIEGLAHTAALGEIASSIASQARSGPVLDEVLKQAYETTQAESASLYMLDVKTQQLEAITGIGRDWATESKKAHRSFKKGEGIAGIVWSEKRPYRWSKSSDPQRDFVSPQPGAPPVASVLAVPILSGDTVVGVLNADSDRLDHFSEAEERLLLTLGRQAIVAIEKAGMLDAIQHMQEYAARASDRAELLNDVVEEIRRRLYVPVGAAFMLDKGSGLFKLEAVAGDKSEHWSNVEWSYNAPHMQTFLERFSSKGTALYVPDVTDQRYDVQFPRRAIAQQAGCKSMLAVPIRLNDQVVGVVDVFSQGDIRTFTEFEKSVLSVFATELGICLKQLNSTRQVQGLHEINTKMASTHDLAVILEAILHQALEITGVDRGWISLFDEQTREMKSRFAQPAESATIGPIQRGQGLAGKAWADQTLVYEPNVQVLDDASSGPEYLAGMRSHIAVPVVLRFASGNAKQVFGIIELVSPVVDAFSRDDRLFLLSLADDAATAVEDSLNHNAIEILEETGKAINERLGADLAKLFDVLERRVRDLQLMEKTIFAIAWYDRERNELWVEGIDKEQRVHDRHALTGGVFKWVIENKKEIDCSFDALPVKPLLIDTAEEGEPAWVLALPLFSKGEVVGVISVQSYHHEPIGQRTRELLRKLGSWAAIAMENANLLRAQEAQVSALEKLNEVGARVTSTLELENVLDRIIEEARYLTGADLSFLQTYVQTRDEFGDRRITGSIRERAEYLNDPEPRPKGIGATREVMEKGWLAVDQIEGSQWEKPFTQAEMVKSFAGIRLKFADEIVGVLFVDFRHVHHFTRLERQVLEVFAAQAAIAIQKARLYERVRVLNKAAGNLACSLNLNDILNSVLATTKEVVKADSVVLYTYDPIRQVFVKGISSGLTQADAPLPTPRGIASKVVAEGRPILTTVDGGTHYRQLPSSSDLDPAGARDVECSTSDPSFLGREDVKTSVAFPLQTADGPVGVLYANFRRVQALSRDELEYIASFCLLAANSLRNATKYGLQEDELRRRLDQLETVRNIDRAIVGKTLNLEPLLDLILEKALQLTGTEEGTGTISLYDRSEDELVLEAVYGATKPVIPRGFRLKLTQPLGIVVEAARTSRPVMVSDIHEDPVYRGKYVEVIPGQQSEIAIPMFDGKKLAGVLNLESPHRGAFSEDDAQILELLANQAVIVVRMARQYEELDVARRELIASRDKEIWEMLGRVARGVYHRVNNSVKPIPTLIDQVRVLWGKEQSAVDERLEAIKMAALRAADLPDEMQKIIALRSIRMEPINLPAVIEAACTLVPTTNCEITVQCDEYRGEVSANERLLREVFRNIVANAVEHMPSGGKIQIRCYLKSDGWIRTTVMDEGTGIPPERWEKIFEYGVTDKTEEEGQHGIGLWYNRGVVEAHGGQIYVLDSVLGKGTTMAIDLPQYRGEG